MSIKNKQTWNEVIKFVVTVLTALLGGYGSFFLLFLGHTVSWV